LKNFVTLERNRGVVVQQLFARYWDLFVGYWSLFGLLLLKFFPPRQDFLVAAEGSVGITTAQILCVTARFSRLRISAFGIHSGIRVSSFLGHWSFGIENGVATTEQIPNDE
jgi:hypothetical protein